MAHRCLTLFTVIVISCIYEAGGVVEVQKLPGWSPWSGWTSCSVTCGYGDSFRQAHWLDKDGQRVNETAREHMGCYIPKSCPVNGNWTIWSGWYWCSSVCGPGRQERYRYCVNPKPANGGLPCSGLANESRACEVQPCPTIPPSFRLSDCADEDFMCDSGLQCVPAAQRCDRTLHCHDGSDEVKCRYVRNQGAILHLSTRILCLILLSYIFVTT
ncbi:thrombospondin-1-like [Crassostrea angulata]|uniref:thrombospondin-1-like n=1 Tax=Magallana angulata TaxID=2784310 RepID=UPI0022B0F2B8|nr:thrombospondin-1-like [Crassostrea angulata]XP_052706353.1 thrombospondin-1-like [Crassostrea angulata]